MGTVCPMRLKKIHFARIYFCKSASFKYFAGINLRELFVFWKIIDAFIFLKLKMFWSTFAKPAKISTHENYYRMIAWFYGHKNFSKLSFHFKKQDPKFCIAFLVKHLLYPVEVRFLNKKPILSTDSFIITKVVLTMVISII